MQLDTLDFDLSGDNGLFKNFVSLTTLSSLFEALDFKRDLLKLNSKKMLIRIHTKLMP